MVHIGSGPNAEEVSVRDLNQAHIGRSFAFQHGQETIYGQLAAVKLFPTTAHLFLAGVTNEVQVNLDHPVYFHKGN
ncbi:hypothetical protein M1D89_19495 [Arthrobacter sp. D3-18]